MFHSNQKLEKFGELEALCSRYGEGDKTVILFHGYGANAHDLFSLQGLLSSSKVHNWYFPEGVLTAPGIPTGKAWFPIDMAALERAMMTGAHRDFSGPIPKKLTSMREAFLRALKSEGISPGDCLLGGFSQGAMLATDIVLNSSEDFAGLMILSGAFLGKEEWTCLSGKKKIRFFQSHGQKDPVLSFDDAHCLYKTFLDAGWSGDWEGFPGEHEIPEAVIYKAKKFIESVF